MSASDLAAAQQRLLARRSARTAALTPSTPSASSLSPLLLNLPPALRVLAQTGLQSGSNLWNTISSPYGTRPAFRVGQVDAELLDEELLSLLQGQVGDALKYFGGHLNDDWSAEIAAALRAALWKLSIWDRGTSYGGSLQGLRYVDARQERGLGADGGVGGSLADPTGWQKAAYGLLTVGGRYGWQKWEDWLLEKEGGYREPSPIIKRLGSMTAMLSSTHEVAALVSFLVFLYNGKYRTLVDRLLRLRLAPSTNQTSREVSFEYLNRQLVWHAFTEFLLFILPLVGISRWRRWLARAWRKAKSMFKRKGEDEDEDAMAQGELGFLPERTCAICYKDQNPTTGASEADVFAASGSSGGVIGSAQTDITNPYETTPCGCIYCFVCLAQRIEAEEGEGWTCLRCGELVKECKPWSGDVIEENASRSASDSRPSSRKSVVFADEGEDEEGEMRDLEPKPLDDEDEEQIRDATQNEEILDESGEWSRLDNPDHVQDGEKDGRRERTHHAHFE